MRINKLISTQKNECFGLLSNSLKYLGKCVKISVEDLQVDIGA